jgi:hypothetical protein
MGATRGENLEVFLEVPAQEEEIYAFLSKAKSR